LCTQSEFRIRPFLRRIPGKGSQTLLRYILLVKLLEKEVNTTPALTLQLLQYALHL
jgi:hypothetical protein